MANTESAFEETDVSAGPAIWTGIGILSVMFASAAILIVAYFYYARYRAEVMPPAPPVAQGYRPEPPEPRLQSSPPADFQEYLTTQKAALNRYTWVDREKGIVTLPIARAIELIARRGIPPQRAPASLMLYPPAAGTRLPGFREMGGSLR